MLTHIYRHTTHTQTLTGTHTLTMILSQSMTEGRRCAMVRTVQSRNLALRMRWIWSFNLQQGPGTMNLVIQSTRETSYSESSHSTCNKNHLNLAIQQKPSKSNHLTCNKSQVLWIRSFNLLREQVILTLVINLLSQSVILNLLVIQLTVIALDIFQTGVTSIRWQKLFTETG